MIINCRHALVDDGTGDGISIIRHHMVSGSRWEPRVVTFTTDDDRDVGTILATSSLGVKLLESVKDARELLLDDEIVLALEIYVSSAMTDHDERAWSVPRTHRRGRQ